MDSMYFYLQQAARRSMWVEAYDCQVGWLDVVNENSNSLFLTIGPRRLLGSYCFSFTCNYIDLSKMCFRCTWFQINAGYKKKKKKNCYSFPCDGPGQGGTCDIWAWDAFYLVVFSIVHHLCFFLFYFLKLFRNYFMLLKKYPKSYTKLK